MHTRGEVDVHLEADVVVVGAGLAGLVAARDVTRAGFEALVLEARDRVGGRVHGGAVGRGEAVELGGQYVGHRDAAIRALAGELGVGLFPVYDRGAHLLELGRGPRRYRGSVPRVRPRTLLALGRARMMLDRRARRVTAEAPWNAPQAAEWDATSMGAFLDDALPNGDGRALLDAAVATLWGEDPHGVNLLAALAFVRTAGSFDRLSATRGGMVQDRIAGGPTHLAGVIAAGLGDRVVLGCPVEVVTDRGSSVEVVAGTTRVTARRAVIAVPPVPALRIGFEPALPPSRRRALEALPMGSVVKVAAVYERPFWRDAGLSGRTLSVVGPVTSTMDSSPPGDEPGVLTGFVPGARARDLVRRAPAERREAVLRSFAALLGPEAARPEHFLELDWNAERWSGGCYFGLPAPGAITGLLPTFARAAGSLHWAGSETAFGSYGGMDGAVLSGQRAAAEALAALASAVGAAA